MLRTRTLTQAAQDIARWQQLIVEVLDHTRGRDVLRALFSWLLAGAADRRASLRVLMTKIHERNPPVRSLLDLVLEEGEKRGVERGMQQGELAGLRLLLGEQLRARFGELPPAVAARIAAADRAELTRWGRNVLAARTLADVFAPSA